MLHTFLLRSWCRCWPRVGKYVFSVLHRNHNRKSPAQSKMNLRWWPSWFYQITFSLNYFWHLNGRWHHRSHVEQSQGSQSILRHWSGNWRYLVFIEPLPKWLMKFHLISRTSYCPFVLYMRRGDKLFFAERAIFRPFSILGECIKLEYLLSCIIYTELLGSAPCRGRAV